MWSDYSISISMAKIKCIIDEKNPHLGGNFESIDPGCWAPTAWKYIIELFDIKSVLDVGSGIGHTSKWYNDQGIDVTAIEGLEYNVEKSVYPTILHDITSAPFIKKVDLVHCVEVVEHIDELYLNNLLTTLCQGNYIFMTHAVPGQIGYHHVNCQPSEYWIKHLETYGFCLLNQETLQIRKLAEDDSARYIINTGMIFKRN
jgi:SAM-dependent methyltransferase